MNINLLEVIKSNLSTQTKKDILYSVAKYVNVEIFSEYEKVVEIEDMQEYLKSYSIRCLRYSLLLEDITDEFIDSYIENMGNVEILLALK